MKRFINFLLLLLPLPVLASVGPVVVVNETGLTYNKSYPVNLNSPTTGGNKFAAQVIWSSATISSGTFTDGAASTASITVASNNILANAATNQITVPSTALILGSPATAQFTIITSTGLGQGATSQITINSAVLSTTTITLNGIQTITLANGSTWLGVATATGTASALATAINNFSSVTGIVASWSVANSSVVYTTATVLGGGTLYSITDNAPSLISTTAFSGAVAPAYVTVNGNVLTNGVQWFANSASSQTAVSLAAAIAGLNNVTASAGGSVVYSTADVVGSAGNSYTLTTSVPSSISVSSPVYSGGASPILQGDVLTFQGVNYPNDLAWNDSSQTSTGTALSIATLLNSFGVIVATAPAGSSVVYATAAVAGFAGNSLTISASPGLTIANPTFTNGQDNANISINGVSFVAGVSFSTGSTTSVTATNLAQAINLALLDGTTAVANANIVYATTTAVGASTNYLLTSSSQSALTLSAPTVVTGSASTGIMTGGKNSAFTINTSTINVPAHQFTRALPLLYSATVAIGGLVNQTTYYALPIDANNIALATSSTGAVAGFPLIVLTSSQTKTTADSYGLVPLAFSQGSASGIWEASNDGVTYSTFSVTSGNVAVSSQTFSAVFPSSTSVQDFGTVDYGFLRYRATPPTQGGVALKVILNAKD